MFCIAAFLVFAVLGIFSASYRDLAKSAWHCVTRRVTFRPCDIDFSEQVKGRLLGRLVVSHPHVARFLDRWIDWLALVFVALSIWSVVYVASAGLNLWVYDTCDPSSAESCSLSGEACGVEQETLGIFEALGSGRVGEWAVGPFVGFGETVSRIPDRLKRWDARDYLAPTATFHNAEDSSKPYSLEIVDPSCKFCRKLTDNLREAGVFDRQNVSYLLYPIPKAGTGGYKFPHSFLMASYIEAVKRVPLTRGDRTVPPDWQILERIFTQQDGGIDLQSRFVMGFSRADAEHSLRELLSDIGYTPEEIDGIAARAASPEVRASLDAQREIVEDRVRTIKIPTLLLDGRRFDRVVSVGTLR